MTRRRTTRPDGSNLERNVRIARENDEWLGETMPHVADEHPDLDARQHNRLERLRNSRVVQHGDIRDYEVRVMLEDVGIAKVDRWVDKDDQWDDRVDRLAVVVALNPDLDPTTVPAHPMGQHVVSPTVDDLLHVAHDELRDAGCSYPQTTAYQLLADASAAAGRSELLRVDWKKTTGHIGLPAGGRVSVRARRFDEDAVRARGAAALARLSGAALQAAVGDLEARVGTAR